MLHVGVELCLVNDVVEPVLVYTKFRDEPALG